MPIGSPIWLVSCDVHVLRRATHFPTRAPATQVPTASRAAADKRYRDKLKKDPVRLAKRKSRAAADKRFRDKLKKDPVRLAKRKPRKVRKNQKWNKKNNPINDKKTQLRIKQHNLARMATMKKDEPMLTALATVATVDNIKDNIKVNKVFFSGSFDL